MKINLVLRIMLKVLSLLWKIFLRKTPLSPLVFLEVGVQGKPASCRLCKDY